VTGHDCTNILCCSPVVGSSRNASGTINADTDGLSSPIEKTALSCRRATVHADANDEALNDDHGDVICSQVEIVSEVRRLMLHMQGRLASATRMNSANWR
jgi:hypothetical protein